MLIRLASWIATYCLSLNLVCARHHSAGRTIELRQQVADLFKHGFDGYMKYAWPADELGPLSCGPLYRDPNPHNVGLNDVHANISLTLIDNLTTLPLIYPSAFPDALEKVVTTVSFDQDVKVQVFELTIRALGSLLSTYQYLEKLPDDPRLQASTLGIKGEVDVKRHMGRLLEMALDLGNRFLPAFDTPTGIPYARINLRHGLLPGESTDTCAAGAGSLVLEFAVLSRLTGDDRFEKLAQKAYLAIWNRRSAHDLVGNTIGVLHGQWLVPGMSGVGAGIDSFFEYGIKSAILLNDDAYLDIFYDSYAAIQTHIRTSDGFIYRSAQLRSLSIAQPSTIDSLGAFLPGMQILAGDIESAIKHHLVYWNLWRKYSAIPESWSWDERKLVWTGWPGRPEFVEATYYLYQATKDEFYLRVGERVLQDMTRRVKTSCGFATMKDVETGDLEDRMESFVLSETLKYLYLLFDDGKVGHLDNKVFTTEGHPLSLPASLQRSPTKARRLLHRGEHLQCAPYRPTRLNGMIVGIDQRPDYEYAQSLVFGADDTAFEEEYDSQRRPEGGYCATPAVPTFSVGVLLSPLDSEPEAAPATDNVPISTKVRHDTDTGHYTISNVSGVHLNVRWKLDNRGYEVAGIGPYRVRSGQQVVVTDPKMDGYIPVADPDGATETHLPAEVVLRFSTSLPYLGKSVFLHAIGATATFGRDYGASDATNWGIGGEAVKVTLPSIHERNGCQAFTASVEQGTVLLLDRGSCTFGEKLIHAEATGAAGVLIIDVPLDAMGDPVQSVTSEFVLVRPNADDLPSATLKSLETIGMIFTSAEVGSAVKKTIEDEWRTVYVEIMPLEGSLRSGEKSKRAPGSRGQEGRLALGQWEITNLRVTHG